MPRVDLGDMEHLVLLAILRLGKEAYGIPILDEVCARSGRDALAVLETDKPIDLLFSDVVMPNGITGIELAREAKRLRPGIKVLYTSGYTENAVIHHGRLDSGVLLLAKPYRKSDMAKMVRKALDS